MSQKDQSEVNSVPENEHAGEKPRLKPIIEGAESLSLGISMVVAVLIGIGLGLLLKSWTGLTWTLWRPDQHLLGKSSALLTKRRCTVAIPSTCSFLISNRNVRGWRALISMSEPAFGSPGIGRSRT